MASRHNLHMSFLGLSLGEADLIQEEIYKLINEERCPNTNYVIVDESIFADYVTGEKYSDYFERMKAEEKDKYIHLDDPEEWVETAK